MKLKHILVLLAVSALVVVAWKLRQGGEANPHPVEGQTGAGVQSQPAAASVELQAPASAGSREAGAAPVEVEQPAEAPPAPVALDIVEIGDGLPSDESPFQDGGNAPVSGAIVVPDYGLKYINVDAAGRAQAAESLRNRVRLSKGRSLKDGGMDEKTVARLMAEAEWLDENPEP